MSAIADKAVVDIALADYAAPDPSGKANIIGQGVTVLGTTPGQEQTTRCTLVVDVRLPIGFAGAEFPLEVALLNEAGELMQMPGESGPQPFRIAQIVTANAATNLFGQRISDHIGITLRAAFDFSNGLPLSVNSLCTWRVQLDGDENKTWTYAFAVAGPPPVPVFG